MRVKRQFLRTDILNLALPYFGLIFIGFACRKARGLPESGLASMNLLRLCVSLPALPGRSQSLAHGKPPDRTDRAVAQRLP